MYVELYFCHITNSAVDILVRMDDVWTGQVGTAMQWFRRSARRHGRENGGWQKKAETQVLRIFNGVGGFGRTCLNKNARGNNIKGEFFWWI